MSGAKESQIMGPAIAMVWRTGLWLGGGGERQQQQTNYERMHLLKRGRSVHLSMYQSKSLQFKQHHDSGK